MVLRGKVRLDVALSSLNKYIKCKRIYSELTHPFFSKNSLSGCDTTSISFPGAILRNEEEEDTARREEVVVIGCPINALVAEDKRTTADTTFAIVWLFVAVCGLRLRE
jgi:hypothetical protein